MGQKTTPTILQRFTGQKGKQRLIEALQRQQLIGGDETIARLFAEKGNRLEFATNHQLMTEGDSDNDIYFIVSGAVSVKVNGRLIATRMSGQHVGEMALIDTTARRSASVCVLEPTVVVKVTEAHFTKVANANPILWRSIAVTIAGRLRERNRFHQAPRAQPVVFIGSSSEGLPIAQCIYNNLLQFSCVPRLWSDGVFECSRTTIEDLVNATKRSDFAVLVVTPDDVTRSRSSQRPAPRDNIIFEIGLFMGALSKERTYLVVQSKPDVKLPTDLLGLTYLRFKNFPNALSASLKPVLRQLRKSISDIGPI